MKNPLWMRPLAALVFCVSTPLGAQTVVEYINQADFRGSPSGQFFYSADAGEQAYVDSGAAGQFKRTGNAFIAGGTTPLCRFYGSVAPGPNSHFYTINRSECDALKAAQLTPKPTAAQQWNYEGNGFAAFEPISAADGKKSCAVGTKPVFRAYNNAFSGGRKNPWDSNHRYSTRRADIDYLEQARGWSDEGIVYCVRADASDPIYPSAQSLEKKCTAPRSDPKYADRQGTFDDFREWVRSYVDERYLWFDEVPRLHPTVLATPQLYFDALRTRAKTASGKDKDEFHFVIPTAQWEAFVNSDGGLGYGFSVAPVVAGKRIYPVVTLVEPGSPAANAGVARGMELQAVNGAELAYGANATTLSAALSPRTAGQATQFRFVQREPLQTLTVSLSAAQITNVPVQSVKTIDTPSGKVGYLLFNDFSLAAEGQLVNAINQLKAASVRDVVIDLRYNSGGYLYIASQLGYMIAGDRTTNKTFQRTLMNRKRAVENNDPSSLVPFYNVSSGIPGSGTQTDVRLPTLNLGRVFILTADATASASESVINSLRGIDVEVVLIGDTTTGKPFGFLAEENCGSTFFAVEFQGVNAKEFGDFADGFAATCNVIEDDLSRNFGDPAESRLSAALAYRTTGQCPAGTRADEHVKSEATATRTGAFAKLPLSVGLPRAEATRMQHAHALPSGR